MGKRALIFGASGVTGWSFVNEVLHDYPKKGVWDGVVAMTNRPLKQEDSLWPADPRLQIVSGIDLLRGSQEELETSLKEKVKDMDKVTHVYYLGGFSPSRGALHINTNESQHTKLRKICSRSWRMPSTCSSGLPSLSII